MKKILLILFPLISFGQLKIDKIYVAVSCNVYPAITNKDTLIAYVNDSCSRFELMKDGHWFLFSLKDQNRLIYTATLMNGLLNDEEKYFYSNAKLAKLTTRKKHKIISTEDYYFETGNLKRRVKYKYINKTNNFSTSEECFDRDGRKILCNGRIMEDEEN